MSNVTMNRRQRRAALAEARRAGKPMTGSEKIDPGTRIKARRAFEIIKQAASTSVGTRSGVYSKCIEGVAVLEALLERGIPASDEPLCYRSLASQQIAPLLSAATLDNVLAVLIHEEPDNKWSWDIVVDVGNGVIFGSAIMHPCASREDAEEGALAGLSVIGASSEAAVGYEPEVEPEKKIQIRVNGEAYIVRKISDDPRFDRAIVGAMRVEQTTYDGLLASFANLVLTEGVDSHPMALTILANCGWTHVTQEILEEFCAANGIDVEEFYSTTAMAEPSSEVVH